MVAYASRDETFLLGLSAQAFVVRPRPVGTGGVPVLTEFNPSTGVIRLVGHGLSTADIVYLDCVGGGSLPGGATALTLYYPLPMSGDLFRIAAAPEGPALAFTTQGAGWSVAIDPYRRIDEHREERSRHIDEHLTAHRGGPIEVDPVTGKYPGVLVGICARMAARSAVTSLQIENAAYRVAVDRLFALEADDKVILLDWKNGKGIYPTPVDQNTVADNGPRARGRAPTLCQRRYI